MPSCNATPRSDDALMIVSFGTSVPSALTSYKSTRANFEKSFDKDQIEWAYTSEIIRKKLKKEGQHILSVNEGLQKFADKGTKVLRVQSLHLANGAEYKWLERTVMRFIDKNPGVFEKVYIGAPLLESRKDMEEVATAVMKAMPAERKSNEAVILMGHGHSNGQADLPVMAMQAELQSRDPLVFLGTVEGSLSFDDALAALKKTKAKKVWLIPFMMVAGDHATNDLAGPEEDSWASMLKKEGYEVSTQLRGLGEIKGIQDIFVRHALETKDDMVKIEKE